MDSKRCFARGRGGGSANTEVENADLLGVDFDGEDLMVVDGFVACILARVVRRREVRVFVRNDMLADVILMCLVIAIVM